MGPARVVCEQAMSFLEVTILSLRAAAHVHFLAGRLPIVYQQAGGVSGRTFGDHFRCSSFWLFP